MNNANFQPSGSAQHPQANSLYYGDCLNVLQQWPSECVDLIYLDPPFNSNRDYNLIFKDREKKHGKPQTKAFNDTWHYDSAAEERLNLCKAAGHPAHKSIKGLAEILPHKSPMMTYLTYMAERLSEMKRVLKKTGSIYLHCDQTASHYLKIVMDSIYGKNNFRNEIIWSYSTGGAGKYWFRRKHDTILFYTLAGKGKYTFNIQTEKSYSTAKFGYSEKQYQDEGGRWYTTPRMSDVWKINAVGKDSSERIGYPTQKPKKLLERIVKVSSNPGDLVLDPFCGCGTTLASANDLDRKWIGIDISSFALPLIKRTRLADENPTIFGVPATLQEAKDYASSYPFEYERWVVGLVPGFAPNDKQTSDGGIDGAGYLIATPDNYSETFAVIQVKGGKPTVDNVKAFAKTIEEQKAALGIFITLDPITSKTMLETQAKMGNFTIGTGTYQRLIFWSITDYFKGARPPTPDMRNPSTGKSLNHQQCLNGD